MNKTRVIDTQAKHFLIRHYADKANQHTFRPGIVQLKSGMVQMICKKCHRSLFVNELGVVAGSAHKNICLETEEKKSETDSVPINKG